MAIGARAERAGVAERRGDRGDARGRARVSTAVGARGGDDAREDADGAGVAACATTCGVLAFHQLEVIVRAVKARNDGKVGTTRRVERRAKAEAEAEPRRECVERASDGRRRETIAASGWLNLYADAAHNFTDGVVIAIAFARRGALRAGTPRRGRRSRTSFRKSSATTASCDARASPTPRR